MKATFRSREGHRITSVFNVSYLQGFPHLRRIRSYDETNFHPFITFLTMKSKTICPRTLPFIKFSFAENLMNGMARGQIVLDFIVRNVIKG